MTITEFALLNARNGLSRREAAQFHGTREDTVHNWSSGRLPTPPGVLAEQRALYARIEKAAHELVALIEEKVSSVEPIELGYAVDDHEARQLGWPCAGAQRAAFGLVIARLSRHQFRLVPRGSTTGTAAAADQVDARKGM